MENILKSKIKILVNYVFFWGLKSVFFWGLKSVFFWGLKFYIFDIAVSHVLCGFGTNPLLLDTNMAITLRFLFGKFGNFID